MCVSLSLSVVAVLYLAVLSLCLTCLSVLSLCLTCLSLCPVSPCPVSAGYNNLEVAEYLLQHGAEVNSQDKGGLIPLHNAASYGVSLYTVNAGSSPLHNAAFLGVSLYTVNAGSSPFTMLLSVG